MSPRRREPSPSPASVELNNRIEANSETSLGSLFRQLARASVAASVVAASGCSTHHDPTPMADAGIPPAPTDAGPEAPPVCEDGIYRVTAGLDPARTYDYLAAYRQDPWSPQAYRVDSTGTPCATATDEEACAADLGTDTSMIFGSHLETTDADGVRRWVTAGEVAAFLGTINTPQEALLLVWHAGYDINCADGQTTVRSVLDGYEVTATRMTADCDPIEITRYVLHISTSGTVTVLSEEIISSEPGVCVGRRPQGLLQTEAPAAEGPMAVYFASVAHLEASAVDAFEILAEELETHGAPDALISEARRAAADEVRHAELMGAIAVRLGAQPKEPVVERSEVRSLFEIALENAVEGCVRETFGALVGTHQAMAAKDADIASAMRTVAEDETRHAALAWKIAEWIEPRLSPGDRAAITIARARAVATLRAEMSVPLDAELVRRAGLPGAGQAVALVDELRESLWA